MQVDLAEKDTNKCLYQGKDSPKICLPPHPELSSKQPHETGVGGIPALGRLGALSTQPREAAVLASLLSEQTFAPTGHAHNTWTGTWL